MNSNNCTVLVNSCDNYEDIWLPFFSVFKDKWGSCKYDVVLNTESKTYNFEGINIICYKVNSEKKDDLWGDRLRKNLFNISSEYVLMLFDDFILEEKVNQEKINQCIKWMDHHKNISVFYFSKISDDITDDGKFPGFDLVNKRADYRLNSAPALWRRDKLLLYTGEIDSPWAWEAFGSIRTYSHDDLFYCSKENQEDVFVYNYKLGGAIHRGKWVYSVIQPVIEKYGINIDLSIRGLENEASGGARYNLKWKIDFLLMGFRMVGFKCLIFIYRVLKQKIMRRLRGFA